MWSRSDNNRWQHQGLRLLFFLQTHCATGLHAKRQQQWNLRHGINFSVWDILPGSFEGMIESLNLDGDLCQGDVLCSRLDYTSWKLGFGKGLTAACFLLCICHHSDFCYHLYYKYSTFECAKNGMVCIVCVCEHDTSWECHTSLIIDVTSPPYILCTQGASLVPSIKSGFHHGFVFLD